jgi:cytochrome c oxidase assembly protein subunit 15
MIDRRALALAGFVFLTMMSGGFVAGNDAGLIYNTFPLMDGQLVAPGYLDNDPWWINFFENPTAVQFDHRVLGVSTVLLALLYWARARRRAIGVAVHAVPVMALLQAALGISTLVLVVPIPLAALHQAGAVTLFTVALLAAQAGRRAV